MTGTERKRLWRLRNPERSRTSERDRAKARRNGYYGRLILGEKPRRCASSASYRRYERSDGRMRQRLWYARLGAGAHRLSQDQRAEAIKADFERRMAEIDAQYAAQTT